jgi:hypothetical protein
MLYAVIVARAAVQDKTTELHVLAVHRDLALDEAMRALAQRPAGTFGHLQRLPSDLPEVGEVLRHDSAARWRRGVTSTAKRRERRQHDLGGEP